MERNEAIETLRQLYSGASADNKAAFECLIPELKESEDEKIRNEIIGYFEHYSGGDNISVKFPKWISYLEKQKDSDKAMSAIEKIDKYIDARTANAHDMDDSNPDKKYYQGWDDALGKVAGILQDVYSNEKQKEQKPLMSDGEIEDKKRDIVAAIRKYYQADYAAYLTSFLKGLSPEDNSEDEYGQEMLGIAYKLMYEYIPENLRTQEFWESLKFMREYTGKVAIIHSYEHPAEWSEEEMIMSDTDKSNLSDALAIIRASNHPFKENMALLLEKYIKR